MNATLHLHTRQNIKKTLYQVQEAMIGRKKRKITDRESLNTGVYSSVVSRDSMSKAWNVKMLPTSTRAKQILKSRKINIRFSSPRLPK